METAATPRQTAWLAMLSWLGSRALPSPAYLSGRKAAALDAHNILPQATALFLQSGSAKTSSLWLDGRLNSRLERPTRMGTYDSADLTFVLSRLDQHAPSRIEIELGWAESEAQRIVSANLERIERLAHELMSRKELTSAAEILDIIEGRPPA